MSVPLESVSTSASTSTIDALARCRQTVLMRANQLLTNASPIPFAERYDALPTMTGLLMTSLEGLKLAEEELREQNERHCAQRAAEDRQLHHYRELFLAMPMPSMVTDIYATILEANRAAAEMFGRGGKYLARTPLAALLEPAARDVFRQQLKRIGDDTGVTRWELRLMRTGDVPLAVHATVRMVPTLGPTGSGVLLWLMQPQVVDN